MKAEQGFRVSNYYFHIIVALTGGKRPPNPPAALEISIIARPFRAVPGITKISIINVSVEIIWKKAQKAIIV